LSVLSNINGFKQPDEQSYGSIQMYRLWYLCGDGREGVRGCWGGRGTGTDLKIVHKVGIKAYAL